MTRSIFLIFFQGFLAFSLCWDSLYLTLSPQDWPWIQILPILSHSDFLIILSAAVLYLILKYTSTWVASGEKACILFFTLITGCIIFGWGHVGNGLLWCIALLVISMSFAEIKLISWQPRLFWFFFAANSLPILYTWMDNIYFIVTRGHINMAHVLLAIEHPKGMAITVNISDPLQLLGKPLGLIAFIGLLTWSLSNDKPVFSPKYGLVIFPVLLMLTWYSMPFWAYPSQLGMYFTLSMSGNFPLPVLPPFQTEKVKGVAVSSALDTEKMHFRGKIYETASGTFKPYKLVLMTLESLRPDYFEPFMPETLALARKHLYLRRHFSNANYTSSGLAAIHWGNYPFNIIGFAKPGEYPPWFSLFQKHGYTMISTEVDDSMPIPRYPGFKNIYHVLDGSGETNKLVFQDILDQLNTASPSLIMAHILTTHWPYYFPDSFARFQPVTEREMPFYNLIEPSPEKVAGIINRYKNSCLYLDSILKDFFQKAEAAGRFKDTVFVVLGDHGESMGEGGFLGHVNSPMLEQFRVPAFIIAPGDSPQTIETPTEHVDIIPTLARYFGYQIEGFPGIDVTTASKSAVMHLDLSTSQVTGFSVSHFVVREFPYMSCIDLVDNRLQWRLTATYDYRVDARRDGLYSMKSNDLLAGIIKRDMLTAWKNLRQTP